MSELQPVAEIWVTAAEGAEKTGFHLDHVRRLARENWRLREDKRFIRVRKESEAYALWLPDLMNYATKNMPRPNQNVDEIWVNTKEASVITGYSSQYLKNLANKNWNMPEKDRDIRVLNRIGRYEIWLPDLIYYLGQPGRGPDPRKGHKNTARDNP
jgi:hypothetical protein